MALCGLVLAAALASHVEAATDAIGAFRRARELTEVLADRAFEARRSDAAEPAWAAARTARDEAFQAVRGARAALRKAVAAGDVGPEVERMLAGYLAQEMRRVADLSDHIPEPAEPDPEPKAGQDPLAVLRAVRSIIAHEARLAAAMADYAAKYEYTTFNATTRAAGARAGVPDASAQGNQLWLGTSTSANGTRETLKQVRGVLKDVQGGRADRMWVILVARSLDAYIASWRIDWADLMATLDDIVTHFVDNMVKKRWAREGLEPLYKQARNAVRFQWFPPEAIVMHAPRAPRPAQAGFAARLDHVREIFQDELAHGKRAWRLRQDERLEMGPRSPEQEARLEAAEAFFSRWESRVFWDHEAVRFGERIVREQTGAESTARTAATIREQATTAPEAAKPALLQVADALEAFVQQSDTRMSEAKARFDKEYLYLLNRPPEPLPPR